MADKSEYYDLLYAYSFGCLDEEDLGNLKQYLGSNDDYYWQELGEFQNLSALLPSILSVDKPDPEVKDRVARKLYRIRNEIKAKRDKQKNVKTVPVVDKVNKTVEPEETIEPIKEKIIGNELQEISDETPKQNVEDFEIVSSQQKSGDIIIPDEDQKEETQKEDKQTAGEQVLNFDTPKQTTTEDEIDTISEKPEAPTIKSREEIGSKIGADERGKFRQDHYLRAERKVKKKSNIPFVIAAVLMFLLAVVFVFLYFKVSSNVKGYKTQIISLNEELSGLKEQFRQNMNLRAMLGSKNLKTVNLISPEIAANASGKLFIDMDTNQGIIELSDFPQLHGSGTYQLWIYIYDNYLSLGKFNPTDKTSFYSFDTPQLSEDSTVSFLVTKELANGSLQPGDKVYLKSPF